MNRAKRSILLLYTGGTIGMVHDPETGTLVPLDFGHISGQVPELKRFSYDLKSLTFDPVVDSSDISPDMWLAMAAVIEQNYDSYDGFVILHGTDTMAYSASALSFLLQNLEKPVIFTGSQLPIGVLRTDGKENLITAIEIAAAEMNGQPMVPEVCIYFENRLMRGNRTTKLSAEQFNAFSSPNYPDLAEAGVHIKYNTKFIRYPGIRQKLSVGKRLCTDISILKIYPGITEDTVRSVLSVRNLRAVILETYGAGNAPTYRWFIDALKEFIGRGGIVLNVTQCQGGSVEMSAYKTGKTLLDTGVISGKDITTEAAIAKLMYLLASGDDNNKINMLLNRSLAGEIT
jgi:L-asparaginase